MSQLESVDKVLDKSLSNIGEDFKYTVDCHKNFFKWRELVGDDADEIFPVKIEGVTLTLFSDNSSLKDKFKFRIPQLITKINSICGAEVVKKIIFGNNFSENRQKVTAKKNFPDEVAEVTLTEDEISDCEKKAAILQNSALHKMLLNCLLAKKKTDKLKKIPAGINVHCVKIFVRRKIFYVTFAKFASAINFFKQYAKFFMTRPLQNLLTCRKKLLNFCRICTRNARSR